MGKPDGAVATLLSGQSLREEAKRFDHDELEQQLDSLPELPKPANSDVAVTAAELKIEPEVAAPAVDPMAAEQGKARTARSKANKATKPEGETALVSAAKAAKPKARKAKKDRNGS